MKIDPKIDFARCLADEAHLPLAPIDAIRPKDEKKWRLDCVHVTKRGRRHVAIATDMRQALVVPVQLEAGDVEGIFTLKTLETAQLRGSDRVEGSFPKLDEKCVPTHEPVAVVCLDAKRLLAVAKALGSEDRVVLEIRGGNEAILVRSSPPYGLPDRKGPLGILMPICGSDGCFPQGESTKPMKLAKAARRKS